MVTSSYSDQTCPVEKENIPEEESKTPIEIKASESEVCFNNSLIIYMIVITIIKEKATTESVEAQDEALPEPVQNQSTSSFCKEILQELLEYILPE